VQIEGAEVRESGQRARSNRNFRLGSDLRRSPPRNVRCLRAPDGQSGSRRRPLGLRDRAEVVRRTRQGAADLAAGGLRGSYDCRWRNGKISCACRAVFTMRRMRRPDAAAGLRKGFIDKAGSAKS
jgi:hypothetical protein